MNHAIETDALTCAPAALPAAPSMWRAVRHLCRYDLARFRVLIAAMMGLELLRAAYVEWTLQLAPIVVGEPFTTAAGEVEVSRHWHPPGSEMIGSAGNLGHSWPPVWW